MVRLCHIQRDHRLDYSVLSRAVSVEVTTHPLQESQCAAGFPTGLTFHGSGNHKDGDDTVFHLR
jgi:hypothetical protein